jgi:hypothetical protein
MQNKKNKNKNNNRTVKLLTSHVATQYSKNSGLNRHKFGDKQQQFRENRTCDCIVVSFSDIFFFEANDV